MIDGNRGDVMAERAKPWCEAGVGTLVQQEPHASADAALP